MLTTLLAAALLTLSTVAQDVSSSQYWHERYHGILSMAAYGDYNIECPKFFTTAALTKSFPDRAGVAPWQVLSAWGPTESGLEGFNVVIPEMDKVVMVFKGLYGWENLNMTAAPLTNLYIDGCEDCTAHAGALKAYEEAKVATNDWEIVKIYINSTGYQWSITGHGFGGMVAQVASLDLGWRGLSHWTHNHGSPRVFNKAAADVFNRLYQGEASQRTVANEDSVPTTIPESEDYTFTLEGMHIYGTNTTYGMNFDICASDPADPNCLGGANRADHEFYYTPIGKCAGSFVAYDAEDQVAFASSQSAAYVATAAVATPFDSSTLATLTSTAAPETTTLSANSPISAVAPAATTTAVTGGVAPLGVGVGVGALVFAVGGILA